MMKFIFVNLKRFDIPREIGGICETDNPVLWVKKIMKESAGIKGTKLIYLLPEALIIPAVEEKPENIEIGSQSVYREDIEPGGNFGAFTSQFPATAAAYYGCIWSMIGHSEERKDKDNLILNEQIKCADNAGLKILYCVGEKQEELGRKYDVIKSQLAIGLRNIKGKVVIGYEPVWAIGPRRTPPDADYIADISKFIKRTVKKEYGYEPLVVYGGGLKVENAAEIASINSIDGGLIALTYFTGNIGFSVNGLKKIIQKYLEV